MNVQKEMEALMARLFQNAVHSFEETEQYPLLCEKRKQLEMDCETMLTKDQQSFILECFATILEIEGLHKAFVYRKAFQDSAALLQWLQALA